MNPLQDWMRCLSFWLFCFWCLSFLLFASPVPSKEADDLTKHSCALNKSIFQIFYIKNCTDTLAEQAQLLDKDTDNRFIGEHLYVNIKEKDRCYLMKRVTDIVVTNVLYKLKSSPETDSKVQEVASFLAHLSVELNGCKPLGEKMHIESNLKQMKDKLDQLGENGKNKMVGELNLLFDYLDNACSKMQQRRQSSQGNKKKNVRKTTVVY